MQLSELLHELHEIYDREGDIDASVERGDGSWTDPFPEVVVRPHGRKEVEL